MRNNKSGKVSVVLCNLEQNLTSDIQLLFGKFRMQAGGVSSSENISNRVSIFPKVGNSFIKSLAGGIYFSQGGQLFHQIFVRHAVFELCSEIVFPRNEFYKTFYTNFLIGKKVRKQ